VVSLVRGEYPRLRLLVGGQASASPQLHEGTPTDDLERLGELVRS